MEFYNDYVLKDIRERIHFGNVNNFVYRNFYNPP